MTIKPRGFEGAMSRVQEIQARLSQLNPSKGNAIGQSPMPTPNAFAPTLAGKIGRNGTAGEVLPLDPFSTGGIEAAGATSQIRTMIEVAAKEAGIDPALFDAVIAQESSYNPRAVSRAGAQGLAQLMPKTAASLGVTDPFDPVQNLRGGAKYLAQMMKQFGGDVRLALAAYNAGPGAVKRAGGVPPIPETQHYVKTILNRVQGGSE